jgi:hypothetical protein
MLLVPKPILTRAREFFEGAGSEGLEGTAVIAGLSANGDQHARHLVIPHQVARRRGGCAVEVTQQGKLQLAASLASGEIYIARIHSHPGEAFHSATDDANPVLTAEGSWSIVVPFFGLGLRRGLEACALFRFVGGKWKQISPHETSRLVQAIDA